ncbi:efflux transporter outer membrane subunit [Hydrocarboniphaga effusa]|uniref:efflux transporter outer membrane subunit n=1 Tax=Hydrocarboniphaga effusa TaxID=243629 RepID=UPI003137A7FF
MSAKLPLDANAMAMAALAALRAPVLTGALAALRAPVLTAALAALLSACSLAPEYEAPVMPEVSGYKENAGDWKPAQPADAAPRGPWWEAFGDAQLNALEARLASSSQDLRAAFARYEQARALAGQTRSNLFPTVDANAGVTRARVSGNAPGNGGDPAIGNDFLATLNLSWEIDLFGRLRNATAAANRRVEASAGELAALDLSLQTQLASTYFLLRGSDSTIALLEDSVHAFERALELTRNRYLGGISAEADVAQAETQVQSTYAQLAAARLQRAQYEHAIAVLVGQSASTFTLAPGAFTVEPPAVDIGLPSSLIERRPDIASAERVVAAANAEIGVARAAWFPVFSFGAGGGYEATRSSDWFDAPSRLWSIGPSLALPLIDGGARASLNQRTRAAYDEAVANYRKAVLVAYQEVEDNLAALNHLAEQARRSDAAFEAASRSLFHANKRYAAGVADYLEVTSTQTTTLNVQRAALDARVNRVVAGIDLIRATGGGWTREQLGKAPTEQASLPSPVVAP